MHVAPQWVPQLYRGCMRVHCGMQPPLSGMMVNSPWDSRLLCNYVAYSVGCCEGAALRQCINVYKPLVITTVLQPLVSRHMLYDSMNSVRAGLHLVEGGGLPEVQALFTIRRHFMLQRCC